jgi:hypothetical protein
LDEAFNRYHDLLGDSEGDRDADLLPLLRIDPDRFVELRNGWAFEMRDRRGADVQSFAGGFTAGFMLGVIAGRLEPDGPDADPPSGPRQPAP